MKRLNFVNLLKSLTHSWRHLITYGLVIICLSALAFCLIKVTYALLSKQIPTNRSKIQAQNMKKELSPMNSYINKKHNTFRLNNENFLPHDYQVDLKEGKKYFILKQFIKKNSNISCLYGEFYLENKSQNHFMFQAIHVFEGKKIENFAVSQNSMVKYLVVDTTQVPTNLINCKNWIHIENLYQINLNELAIDETVQMTLRKSKCRQIPFNNIMSIKSLSSHLVYVTYDSLTTKLNLCLQKKGIAFIQTMEHGSEIYKTRRIVIN